MPTATVGEDRDAALPPSIEVRIERSRRTITSAGCWAELRFALDGVYGIAPGQSPQLLLSFHDEGRPFRTNAGAPARGLLLSPAGGAEQLELLLGYHTVAWEHLQLEKGMRCRAELRVCCPTNRQKIAELGDGSNDSICWREEESLIPVRPVLRPAGSFRVRPSPRWRRSPLAAEVGLLDFLRRD